MFCVQLCVLCAALCFVCGCVFCVQLCVLCAAVCSHADEFAWHSAVVRTHSYVQKWWDTLASVIWRALLCDIGMSLLQRKTQISNYATLSILRTKIMIYRARVGQSTLRTETPNSKTASSDFCSSRGNLQDTGEGWMVIVVNLPACVRSFDLFRHRRVAIVSKGVHDFFFLEVCSWGRFFGSLVLSILSGCLIQFYLCLDLTSYIPDISSSVLIASHSLGYRVDGNGNM